MNWYQTFNEKYAQSQSVPNGGSFDRLSDDQLLLMKDQCNEGIHHIERIIAVFGKASFATTMRQPDLWLDMGPQILFCLYGKDVDVTQFIQFQEYTTRYGIQVRGFVKSSGFDDTLYIWSKNKWIPAEKPTWLGGFESGKNLAGLIGFNVLRKVQSNLVWRRYTKVPAIRNLLETADEYRLSVQDTKEMFKDYRFDNEGDRENFMSAMGDWWWGSARKNKATQEDFTRMFSKVQEEFDRTKGSGNYVYDLTMDPNGNGSGKYISEELIEQAFRTYGDFDVLVRYQAGRQFYRASEIVRFMHSQPDDDQAYEFYNQLNGIRDFSTKSKPQ